MQCRFVKVEETYKLRLEVLKTCEEYVYKYQGDFDKNTYHLATFEQHKMVGIVSLFLHTSNTLFEKNQMQLRGMAVSNNTQKSGIGSFLLTKAQEFAKEKDINVIWCNARDYSVGFYQKLGYQTIGEKFFIENVCDHYVMFKKIDE